MWGSSCFDSSDTNSYQYNGHTTDAFDYSTCTVRVGWARECHIVENRANWWNTSGYSGIPTNGNTTMNLSYHCDGWGSLGGNIVNTNWMPEESQPSKFVILNQNGTIIAQGLFRDYPYTGYYNYNHDAHVGNSEFSQTLNISLPEGTTHVYIHLLFHLSGSVWFTAGLTSLSFSGASEKICAFEEGDVEHSKASLGGTSNTSTTDTINGTGINTTQTAQTGNGTLQLKAVNGNLLNGLNNISYLNNITIRDLAIPDSIEDLNISNDVTKRVVEWEAPESNGTEYELKAQTYIIDFNSSTGTTLIMDTELN